MMNTPIYDFIRGYEGRGMSRFHMPGHKGAGPLGCEGLDITEIPGADALYEAGGIIAQSEANAAALFGSARTVFSTEGSSQCIRAMLHLALTHRGGRSATVVAARNVHKAFVYAAALLDLDVVWLWPAESRSVCSCPVTAEDLEKTLTVLDAPPAAVYITSPDYLGGQGELAALAAVCHAHGTILAVDNAHGAYLHFLPRPVHPLDLGADICCDSAHKTLPVLTGGAYLHIARTAPAAFCDHAKESMALFGSTSPSYLILSSLDLCNRALKAELPSRLAATAERVAALKARLAAQGWQTVGDEPLKLTIDAPSGGWEGTALAQHLREWGVECEYADGDFVVLMAAPGNSEADFVRVAEALGQAKRPLDPAGKPPLPPAKGRQAMSIREALFAPCETVAAKDSLGRICGAPTVACPPAIPIAVSGEVITPEAVALFARYGVEEVSVVL